MMKLKNPLILRCFDFQALELLGKDITVYCCESCHEDEDHGHDNLMEIQPQSKKDHRARYSRHFSLWDDTIYAEVCCIYHTLLEKLPREQWAQVARTKRKRLYDATMEFKGQ